MMKLITKFLLILFVFSWPGSASAGALAEYMEAKKIYLAVASCMAAYNNRPGSQEVAAFEQVGWRVEPRKKVGDKADANYLFAWDPSSEVDRDHYILAVAGTESARDVKVDLRTNKVYFAGATLEEFTANAAKKDLPADVPRVHEGFNQASMVLLSAESTQSNDVHSGEWRSLTNILKEDSQDKVYLVGHSLGGAVVTLLAARLIDMGVRPSQLEIITFGAPAVGNESFAEKYDGKVAMTRVVVEGDLVPIALRRVYGGYRHIGREMDWLVPDPIKDYFRHDVPVYLDLALKNFYTKRREAINKGLLPRSEPISGENRIYVASVKNNLPPALKSEFPFMQEALWEEYDMILPGFIADTGEKSLLSNLEKAAAAGCSLLVVPEIGATKVHDGNAYYVSLNQTVYRVSDGKILNLGIFGCNTKVMTPMGALIHGARTMRSESASWAGTK